MLETINTFDPNIVGFRFDGGIDKADIDRFYDALESKMQGGRKVLVYAEVKSISLVGITWEAIKQETRRIWNHPSIIANLAKVVVVTDLDWVKTEFAFECALLPTLEGASFSFGEEDKAIEWLRTDQRASERLDLTYSEVAQVNLFKFASGVGIGMLAAGCLSKQQRRNIGVATLIGSVVISLPVAIKILNNNRQLLDK